MTQFGRRGRLLPQVSMARRAVESCLTDSLGRAPQPEDLLLIGLSGGPDSLALAAAAAHFSRRRRFRVGAVVVDHQLQEGSAEVARTAAGQARALGLEPVEVRTVVVERDGDGLEAAARAVRYAALGRAVRAHGAHGVALGHTRDDQAETVLLGLARGSGTRSLGGMAPVCDRDGLRLMRPLLSMTREDTVAICDAEQMTPWTDPTNADQSLMRAKVRHTVLPFLERELGPGVGASLARSAAILGPDAGLLEDQAGDLLDRAQQQAALDVAHGVVQPVAPGATALSLRSLQEAPEPLSRRALAMACVRVGGEPVSFERLNALGALAAGRGEAGPIEMAGKVSVYRRRAIRTRGVSGESGLPRSRGILELRPTV
ncbi:tRNA lysidine(34) synthetase TilS [Kocuria coralli]|uniref:tRNA(Ile)-lysidine synthase n=1 Tax=Kocuria coralli TaxID=1461025 RepID=A0A5J5KZ59_9MICC|nr:tRNA lysidine(34) synthetase TilS [Kocuria coralli]KAA9394126.1 tRNA lysidine(34) synthetase TilS [Kocuria coralli]